MKTNIRGLMQLFKPKNFVWLAILEIVLTLASLGLMVVSGGIDSPYYTLWLLAIVLSGAFSWVAIGMAIGLTAVGYLVNWAMTGWQAHWVTLHWVQALASLLAAGLAVWIKQSRGQSGSQHAQVAKLSGQLSQESLKSEVLMKSVGEGVLVVDRQRRIQLFNPAASSITGWDPSSAQNIDYRLVLNLHDAKGEKVGDKLDPFQQCWQQAKSLVRTDLTMETKGGHKIAIQLSVSPILDNKKQITGGIGLFRDISAEKEVERQRNEFISTASHEMRTPVAAVEGYLSLAMNPAVATVDDRAKSYLEKAHASTQHLGELFRDLLSVTKLEDSGKLDAMEVFDLTHLAKEAVEDMQFSAQKKGLEMQFTAGEEKVRGEHSVAPVYAVRGNPQRLREVIDNLIENALKFTPKGRVMVSVKASKDTVTLSVSDTGIGISKEDIGHLFQKFYRIDNSATRTIGGTGLGLYLCRTIVELLGGRIWAESKFGEGTTFSFSLPRVASDALATKPAHTIVIKADPTQVPVGLK